MSLEKYYPNDPAPQRSWPEAYRLYTAEHGADMPVFTLVLTLIALYFVLDNFVPYIGGWNDAFRVPAAIVSVMLIIGTRLRIKRYR